MPPERRNNQSGTDPKTSTMGIDMAIAKPKNFRKLCTGKGTNTMFANAMKISGGIDEFKKLTACKASPILTRYKDDWPIVAYTTRYLRARRVFPSRDGRQEIKNSSSRQKDPTPPAGNADIHEEPLNDARQRDEGQDLHVETGTSRNAERNPSLRTGPKSNTSPMLRKFLRDTLLGYLENRFLKEGIDTDTNFIGLLHWSHGERETYFTRLKTKWALTDFDQIILLQRTEEASRSAPPIPPSAKPEDPNHIHQYLSSRTPSMVELYDLFIREGFVKHDQPRWERQPTCLPPTITLSALHSHFADNIQDYDDYPVVRT
ncbi:hypothetical protein PLICRDRAFT_180380 [Plicaturopsis crispa FD-325 SS-3]|uniref:Uncharacterized protein n=1 Tax=Plicaturopsis crispa FD-325 SS-3 TaxID=944288 RepID=A0A0C9SKC1_PLICR|nr:hypothetical protein PLICRDRAFT_180380 [Plicaturopsis crispa FD-325 SS-3]